MKLLFKKIGYLFLYGATFFIVLGILIGFTKLAMGIPLSFFGAISPIKNIFFLIFLVFLSLILTGLLVKYFLKKVTAINKNKFGLITGQWALANNGALIIITGTEMEKSGAIFFTALWPFVHPISGLPFRLSRNEFRLIKTNPAEIIKIIMSNGTASFDKFEFIDEEDPPPQLTDD